MTPSAAAGRVLAAVLANSVNAALLSALNDDLLAIRRLIYVESDPGVEQIKID